jgi:hypothetical protein
MMMRLVSFVALALTLACGCACVERTRAQGISRQLHLQSIERSTRAMSDAARRQGAALLPERVETWSVPWMCPTETPESGPCEPWWAGAAAPMERVVDSEGKPHVVVPVANDGTDEYIRLARRGKTLLLLVPRLSHRVVGERSACECDAGLVSIPPTYRAFVLDDVGFSKLERVSVPVTEDYIHWECKAKLVHNETPRRNVAGCN